MSEREQLLEYREKLAKLSEDEKIQRDLYLRQLGNGTIQGPMTGYASLDKPWLKYFDELEIFDKVPQKTIYNFMVENNIEYPNQIVIEYLKRKYNYKELFQKIDETTRAFIKLGIKKGDIVTICSITTPEVLYAFYALNRLGAISNFIDLRYNASTIDKYLKETKSDFFVTLDVCLPNLEKIIEENHIKDVIIIDPANSGAKTIKTISSISKMLNFKTNNILKKYISWNNFIENGKNEIIDGHEISYEADMPAVIVHTGGTTGIPKGVILSNDDFNSVVLQIKHAHTSARRNYRFLNIMPPFIAYGIALGLYAPVALGWDTIIIPAFDPKQLAKLIKKNKPEGIMGVPTYFENVMKSPMMNKYDLSFLKDILLGGDKTLPEFEIRLNKFLRDHNSKAVVSKGYSMTEASSLATFSTKEANELGSVGVPLIKSNVSAFKPNTQEELQIGEIGELCINSSNEMIGYYNNPEETIKVKQQHGSDFWIHSGDVGYVSKDGLVFVKDRIKRMIIRSGFKVFPSEIEKIISSHPAIESCAVIGIPDEIDITVPKVFIVLKPGFINLYDNKKISIELEKLINGSELPPYFKPVDYEIINNIPVTNIGKIDYLELEKTNKQNNILCRKKQKSNSN